MFIWHPLEGAGIHFWWCALQTRLIFKVLMVVADRTEQISKVPLRFGIYNGVLLSSSLHITARNMELHVQKSSYSRKHLQYLKSGSRWFHFIYFNQKLCWCLHRKKNLKSSIWSNFRHNSQALKFECWNPFQSSVFLVFQELWGWRSKGPKTYLLPDRLYNKNPIPSAQNASLPRKVLSLEWKASALWRWKYCLS